MMRIGNWGIWLMAGLQLGCNGCSGASKTRTAIAAPDEETAPDEQRRFQPVAVDEPSPDASRGHVFKPVTHPPHTFASYRPIPETSLPRLVQRSCFVEEREVHYRPYPQPSPHAPRPMSAPKGARRASGAADGFGSSGLGGAHTESKKAEAAAPAAAAKPAPDVQMEAAPAEEGAVARGRAEVAERAQRRPANEPVPAAPHDDSPSLTRDSYHDWGTSLYLSNDDTMSLSSAQRVLFAIDQGLPIPAEHIRPHELLNYFSFDTAPAVPTDDFSVLANIAAKPGQPGMYTLGLSVSGRDVTRETRRNAGLTLVIDRSGSMAAEGRMEYLKQGLRRMTSELKAGDLVNMVLFDDSVCTPLENFVVGRDSMALLERTISRLQPRGSTDLNAGLTQGYRLANEAYRDEFTNRVVLISDAITNTGMTDPEMISLVGESYDKRRIRLSAVGVGRDFNDELLDRLTEKGRGAYVFLGSEAEVDAVFGSRFVSMIETVANDVHFRLHLPPSLRMNVFYGEESSVVKSDVQAIHYFAGTNQLFLSDLMARNETLNPRDEIMLTVEYEHPESNTKQVEEFAFNLGAIAGAAHNVDKGRLLMSFVDGVKDIELSRADSAGRYNDGYASEQCANGRVSLREQADRLRRDPEVDRILSLWQRYCSRYPEPTRPTRVTPRVPEKPGGVQRQPPRGNDVWPGAR